MALACRTPFGATIRTCALGAAVLLTACSGDEIVPGSGTNDPPPAGGDDDGLTY